MQEILEDKRTPISLGEIEPSATLHAETPAELKEAEIPKSFTELEQRTIDHRLHILSGIARMVGQDFGMKVSLNAPGAGWHWNFKTNEIKVDPVDLLKKPLDYCRFVILHEGLHRRLSRVDGVIPEEVWKQPGFSFMSNAIEDPRINNHGADYYPFCRQGLDVCYSQEVDFEDNAKKDAQAKLGYVPRHIQAGFEYIKAWYADLKGIDTPDLKDLPSEVVEAVQATREAALYSSRHYPNDRESRQERLVLQYAEASYEINRDQVWPEFKKLVDLDMEDQKMAEFLRDLLGEEDGAEKGSGEGSGVPQDLKDKLSPEELSDLEQALDSGNVELAPEGAKGGKAIPLDSLPESLQEKIKEYIDSLPEDKKSELEQRAKASLSELGDEISEELSGKLKSEPFSGEVEGQSVAREPGDLSEAHIAREKDLGEFREKIREITERDKGVYEKYRREVFPLIQKLRAELREIFSARHKPRRQSGFRSGNSISLRRVISEIGKAEINGVPYNSATTRAFTRKERPTKRDYAITLLVDLSGSMQGDKIEETFKATIVLAEVLNHFNIRTEVVGFNDRLHLFKGFDGKLDGDSRDKLATALKEVHSERARYNDDGWALGEAAKRLSQKECSERFLIILSDGQPEPSVAHSGSEYDLHRVVKGIRNSGEIKLVGLGVGKGTGHVADYYPNHLADIEVGDLAGNLSLLLRDIVEQSSRFSR